MQRDAAELDPSGMHAWGADEHAPARVTKAKKPQWQILRSSPGDAEAWAAMPSSIASLVMDLYLFLVFYGSRHSDSRSILQYL